MAILDINSETDRLELVGGSKEEVSSYLIRRMNSDSKSAEPFLYRFETIYTTTGYFLIRENWYANRQFLIGSVKPSIPIHLKKIVKTEEIEPIIEEAFNKVLRRNISWNELLEGMLVGFSQNFKEADAKLYETAKNLATIISKHNNIPLVEQVVR